MATRREPRTNSQQTLPKTRAGPRALPEHPGVEEQPDELLPSSRCCREPLPWPPFIPCCCCCCAPLTPARSLPLPCGPCRIPGHSCDPSSPAPQPPAGTGGLFPSLKPAHYPEHQRLTLQYSSCLPLLFLKCGGHPSGTQPGDLYWNPAALYRPLVREGNPRAADSRDEGHPGLYFIRLALIKTDPLHGTYLL